MYDIKGITNQYVKGIKIKDIAKEYNLSENTISNILKRNNIEILKPNSPTRMFYGRTKLNYRDLYDVDGIVSLYRQNKTLIEVAETYNVSRQTVTRILKSEGVKSNEKTKRKVKCITTNTIYDSISEASKSMNVSMKHLSYCLRKREGICISNLSGEKLMWEYADNE